MNDTLKLQKLAAAKSKLKSHQQKKHKKADSDANGTTPPAHDTQPENNIEQENSVPQIQSYFGGAGVPPCSSAAIFFDAPTPSIVDPTLIAKSTNADNVSELPSARPIEPDATAFEDPEINPNEIFQFANQKKTVVPDEHNEISVQEQLKQLTEQISHVIDSNGNENYSNYSDLEKRNLELASNYESCKLKCDQLNAEVREYKARVNQLEHELQLTRVDCENRIRNELGPLENEIATHRQTFGILVGEKTELAASLAHTEMMMKEKNLECSELQTRLKSSRMRVADLERDLASLKDESSKYAQWQSGRNDEFEKLKIELNELKHAKVEAEQDLSEMRERLKKLQKDNETQLENNNDLQSKLSMANVKLQQLTAGIDSSASERFVQEKLALEKQILDLNTSLKGVIAERDQASTQYQHFVQQLNGNLSTLAERLEESTSQNQALIAREQELVQHVNDLEKRLQTVASETAGNIYKQKHSNSDLLALESAATPKYNPELDELRIKVASLEASTADLTGKLDTVRGERDEYIKDLEHKKHTIEELESLLEELKGNQSNSSQLLAAIESEKVAASRAVEQNINLKQQLTEIQEAYIRMTNDKAELLNQLSTEQFRYKELEEAQVVTHQQLHTLSEAIAIKDRELTEMRARTDDISKQVVQQDQLNDRLRHYEAHEHSVQSLTNELQRARDEIQSLLARNSDLEVKLSESLTPPREDVIENEPETHNEKTASASTPAASPAVELNSSKISSREAAMQQLEVKFMRTMQEIANLQDEKQILEHIVLQLQGETETIGEYIALYQHQRGVLKQRAVEKETQLKQLAKDREHMKAQLQTLNELIRRLLAENKITDGDLLQQQAINNSANALCEEHAKLHEEMNERRTAASSEGNSQETAQQIIALLGEIKTSNLVQPADVSDNFHPCPLCSGQLITV